MRGLPLLLIAFCFAADPVHGAAPPRPHFDPLPKGAIARLGHVRMVAPDPPFGARLAVSPDGRWAFAHGHWFDLSAGRQVLPPVHVPKGYAFDRFFADGSYAVEGKDQTLLFAPKSTTPRAIIPGTGLHFDDHGRSCLRSGPESRDVAWLADLKPGGKIDKWKKVTTPKVTVWSGLSGAGGHVAWADDDKPPRLYVRDLATDRLTRINPRSGSIYNVALSPDGKSVACVVHEGVHLFDARTGKSMRTAEVDLDSYECRFTPDGKSVVALASGGVALIPTDRTMPVLQSRLEAYSWALLPDSRRVAVVNRLGVLRIHDLRTGKQLDRHSRFPGFVGVRMIGRHVAASWSACGRFVTWDVRNGRVLTDWNLTPKDRAVRFAEVHFSPDGRQVAACGGGGYLLADAATGRSIRETTFGGRDAPWAFFHPVRPEVTICDPGQEAVVCYDRKTGERLRQLEAVKDARSQYLPDGRTFLAVSNETVSLREAHSGKARWSKALPFAKDSKGEAVGGWVCHLALVDRGRRAVVVRAQDASVYETQTGRMTQHLPFRSGAQDRAASVSACGRWLAIVDSEELPDQEEVEPRDRKRDWFVRVFDLASKDPTAAAHRVDLPRLDFQSMALDADGSRLVTAHGDGTCFTWDLTRFVQPTPKRALAGAWERLADLDPSEAQEAIEELLKDDAKAVKLFAEKLTPAVVVPPARIAEWVAELDSEDFDRRTAAEKRLAEVGDQAEPQLRKVVRKPASVEQARRAEALLKRLDPKNDANHQRHLRALEILEGAATKEAIALLEKLAKGAPAARLTREAKESLQRLKERDER